MGGPRLPLGTRQTTGYTPIAKASLAAYGYSGKDKPYAIYHRFSAAGAVGIGTGFQLYDRWIYPHSAGSGSRSCARQSDFRRPPSTEVAGQARARWWTV